MTLDTESSRDFSEDMIEAVIGRTWLRTLDKAGKRALTAARAETAADKLTAADGLPANKTALATNWQWILEDAADRLTLDVLEDYRRRLHTIPAREVLIGTALLDDLGPRPPVIASPKAHKEWKAKTRLYLRIGLYFGRLVVEADDLERELIAIDENFVSTSLSPAEEAIALGRRKEIHEALNGRAKSKGAHAANAKMGNSCDATAKMAEAFTTIAARVLDRSERQVQRIVERASLGADDLARIAGTSLDSGTEIDLLLKLTPEERAQFIDRAAAGEIVSAVSSAAPATLSGDPAAEPPGMPGDSPSTETGEKVEIASEAINPIPHELSTGADAQRDHGGARALMDAWRAASEPERMAFLAWVTAAASSTAATA
jgi:hypothetical protein